MLQADPNPLVTVVIPVYNGADHVGDSIDSALAQTYSNLEVIVVDDGSTDATPTILADYARRDPRVRILQQANGGVARARNRAVAEANGVFIAPLDADDLWDPQKIELQVLRMLEAGPDTGFVYCWWIWIDVHNTILDRSPRWQVEGHVFEKLLQINFTGNASIPLIRREALLQTGGYNPKMADTRAGGCEDWEVVLGIAAKYSVALVSHVLVGYRRRSGSMSTACDTMWRSHQMLLNNIRPLRPHLSPHVLRRTQQQFHLYLAGLAFWSGNLLDAIRWGFRSGWQLASRVAPPVLRLIFKRRKRRAVSRMLPGVALRSTDLPSHPLLPYDEIYRRLGGEWRA